MANVVKDILINFKQNSFVLNSKNLDREKKKENRKR